MSNKLLTEDEVRALRASPFVKSVSPRTVIFTPEFKSIVYREQFEGKRIADIFECHGISAAALGETRIRGFCEKLAKFAKREEGFEIKPRSVKAGAAKEESIEKQVYRLRNELAYTRQEVEFLKKTQQADMEARKSWESRHRHK